MPRPIARHGLSSRQTSPSSSEAHGTPTQNATYTIQGARLSRSSPSRPGRRTPSTAAPRRRTAPSTTSTAAGNAQQPALGPVLQARRRPQHRERHERHAPAPPPLRRRTPPRGSADPRGRRARGRRSARRSSLETTTAPPRRGRRGNERASQRATSCMPEALAVVVSGGARQRRRGAGLKVEHPGDLVRTVLAADARDEVLLALLRLERLVQAVRVASNDRPAGAAPRESAMRNLRPFAVISPGSGLSIASRPEDAQHSERVLSAT